MWSARFHPIQKRKITVLCTFSFPLLEGRPEIKDSEQNDIKHSPYKSALNFIVNANFVQKYLLSLIFYWSHFCLLKQDHTIQNCKLYEQVEIFVSQFYETCSILQREWWKIFHFTDKHGCECFFRPSANSCIVAAEMLVFMSQRSVHVMWNFIASEWRQTHTFRLMFVCKPLLWSGTFPLTLIKYCLSLSLSLSLSLLKTFILHSLLLTVIWQEHTKQKQTLSTKPKFKTLWETKK